MSLPKLTARYIVLFSDADVIKTWLGILRTIGGNRFIEIPDFQREEDLARWFIGGGLKACEGAYAVSFGHSLLPLIDLKKMKWLHGKNCIFVICNGDEKGFVGKRLARLPGYFASDDDLCKSVFNIGDKADDQYPKQGDECARTLAPFTALAETNPMEAAEAFEKVIHATHEKLKGNVSFSLHNPQLTIHYSPVDKNVEFLYSVVPERRGVKARTVDVVCTTDGFEKWRDYHKTGQVVVRLEEDDVICANTLMEWNGSGYSVSIFLVSDKIKYDRDLTPGEQKLIQENKLKDEAPGVEITPQQHSLMMYLAMQAFGKSELQQMCIREEN